MPQILLALFTRFPCLLPREDQVMVTPEIRQEWSAWLTPTPSHEREMGQLVLLHASPLSRAYCDLQWQGADAVERWMGGLYVQATAYQIPLCVVDWWRMVQDYHRSGLSPTALPYPPAKASPHLLAQVMQQWRIALSAEDSPATALLAGMATALYAATAHGRHKSRLRAG